MTTLRHTAVYLRVSTEDQSLASQEPDCLLVSRRFADPIVLYRDHYTGATMERPGFDRLLTAIRSQEVERLVVWRLDRLGRTAVGLIDFLAELVERGVVLLSVKDGLDLSTPAGRLLANLLASFAAYEREVIAERVRAGIAAAKALGKRIGGRARGSKNRKRQRLEPTVLRLHEAGMNFCDIARTVGLSVNTIRNICKSESNHETAPATAPARDADQGPSPGTSA